MPSNYDVRSEITSNYGARTPLQSDLWHLITQLWILCDNSGNRILFHTWIFYESPSPYNNKPIINSSYNLRPNI